MIWLMGVCVFFGIVVYGVAVRLAGSAAPDE